MSYMTVDDAASVNELIRWRTRLVKDDTKSAYWIIPVNPEGWALLEISSGMEHSM